MRAATICRRSVWLLGAVALTLGVLLASASSAVAAPPPGSPPNVMTVLALRQAAWLDPAQAANDDFGVTVALSGDIAIVGAINTAVAGHPVAGTAYIYTRSGSSWKLQTTLDDPARATGDCFGCSVALCGNTALVGAYGTTVAGHQGAGAAYIYTRSGSSWTLQATIDDPGPGSDSFGTAVALTSGTALVSAEGTTVAGHFDAGAAYLYVGSGSNWTLQATLDDPGVVGQDYFGYSVALCADRALVGAAFKTVAGMSDAGAAYLFDRSGSSWAPQAAFDDPNPSANDYFGSAVALSDGLAMVGDPGATVAGQSAAGAVGLYNPAGSSMVPQATLTDPGQTADDYFGYGIAIAGDSVLVSACGTAVAGKAEAGVVYLYGEAGWGLRRRLTLDDPALGTDDDFGMAVGLSNETALIGATGASVAGQSGAGAAYIERLYSPVTALRVSSHSVALGETLTVSGTVKDFVPGARAVAICRRVSGRLHLLKRLTMSASGAFRGKMKLPRSGVWVLVATYKADALTFTSGRATVKVHR